MTITTTMMTIATVPPAPAPMYMIREEEVLSSLLLMSPIPGDGVLVAVDVVMKEVDVVFVVAVVVVRNVVDDVVVDVDVDDEVGVKAAIEMNCIKPLNIIYS
ncbi:hypothetical protein DPMN_174576 [Dreissena polymorpha]|uniref:Uncharacterized protein n=1 Tax=Dreissena polymorpha TaxID=45954 RepID=A0A9D4E6L7_DREPO|nr:hypothetical protein DPMN_174576 [Dreissena polymorpha]